MRIFRVALVIIALITTALPLSAQTSIPLSSDNPDEIVAAIESAVANQENKKAVIDQLIAALNGEAGSIKVRERAAWALGALEAKAGIPALLKAVKHKGLLIRSEALGALARMRAAAALPVFIDIAKSDPILSMRERATVGLGMLGSDKALGAIVALSSDPREEVRGAAALAMGALQSKKNDFRELLKEMSVESSSYVQDRAKRALEIADRKTAAVTSQLNAEDEANDGNVRLFAAIYFQQFGKGSDLSAVKQAFNVEADDDVRFELKKAVKRIEKRVAEEKARKERERRAKQKQAAQSAK